MRRRAILAVRIAIAGVVGVGASAAAAQEMANAFQPVIRIGYSPDFGSSNAEYRYAAPAPSAAAAAIFSESYSDIPRQLSSLMYIDEYGALSGDSESGLEGVPVGDDTRFADDLDGKATSYVTRVLADIDGDGVIEPGEVIGIVHNFGDLHTYDVGFDEIAIKTERDFTSLELMKQHVLFGDATTNQATTGWRFEAFRNDWSAALGDEVRGQWAVRPERREAIRWTPLRELAEQSRCSVYSTAGLRGLWLEDRFAFDGRDSILGHTWVDQNQDQLVIGPQLGLGAVAEASIFRLEFVTLGLVGYGRVESQQHSFFGANPTPGVLNGSAAPQAISSQYRSNEEHVAWHGETRLTASCQLTQQLRFDATWRWFVSGPIDDAAGSIVWNAPAYGMQPTDGDAAYGNDWFLGLTYTR